ALRLDAHVAHQDDQQLHRHAALTEYSQGVVDALVVLRVGPGILRRPVDDLQLMLAGHLLQALAVGRKVYVVDQAGAPGRLKRVKHQRLAQYGRDVLAGEAAAGAAAAGQQGDVHAGSPERSQSIIRRTPSANVTLGRQSKAVRMRVLSANMP